MISMHVHCDCIQQVENCEGNQDLNALQILMFTLKLVLHLSESTLILWKLLTIDCFAKSKCDFNFKPVYSRKKTKWTTLCNSTSNHPIK
jgi:hypothetical protein